MAEPPHPSNSRIQGINISRILNIFSHKLEQPEQCKNMPQRVLPARINPHLLPDQTPPIEILAERRQLATTRLYAKPGLVGTSNATRLKLLGEFDYVHLKAPLPKDLGGSQIFPAVGAAKIPESYYLMRRCSDGYVSVTGLFKASFPWATKLEEDRERALFFASPATDQAEEAGNIWASAQHALDLAIEYGVHDWIAALLDNKEIARDPKNPSTTSPPPFEPKVKKEPKKAASTRKETMSTRGHGRGPSRDLRSQSPVKKDISARPKATPRKSRKSKKQREAEAEIAESVAESGNEVLDEEEDEDIEAALEAAAGLVDIEDSDPLSDGDTRVTIVEDVFTDENDNETTRTTVKVQVPGNAQDLELPQSTEGVLEMAHVIVENAKLAEEAAASAANTPLAPQAKSKGGRKRKAEVLEEEVVEEVTGPYQLVEMTAEADATNLVNGEVDMHPAKRTRVMVPAEEYRRERVKRRALMGLSGALAVGVMLPFLSNLF